MRGHPGASGQPARVPGDKPRRRERGLERPGRDRGRRGRDAAVGLLEKRGHLGQLLGRAQGLQGSAKFGREEEMRETPLQLQRVDHDGHPPEPGEEAHVERYIRVHNAPLPLLREQQARVAELDPAQPIVEQVFRQSAPPLRRSRQRELLDARSEFRGRVHRRDDGQASAEDNGGVAVAAGGVQEERGPRRTVPLGVRAARMAGVPLHPALSAPGRRRRLPTGDRRLLHPRRLPGEPAARRRGHRLHHQPALQAAAAPGRRRTPPARPLFHGEAAPTPDSRRIPARHRRFRHPRVRHALRLLLHSQVAGRPPAPEHGRGVRAQPAADHQVPPSSAAEPTDLGHRVPRQQPGTHVAPFAAGHRLQFGPAAEIPAAQSSPAAAEADHRAHRKTELNLADRLGASPPRYSRAFPPLNLYDDFDSIDAGTRHREFVDRTELIF